MYLYYESVPLASQASSTFVSWVLDTIKTLYLNTPVAFALLPDLLVLDDSRLQPLARSLALQLTAAQVALMPTFTLNEPFTLNLYKTSPSAFLTVAVWAHKGHTREGTQGTVLCVDKLNSK